MDLIAVLKELSSLGITDVVCAIFFLYFFRRWLNEMPKEIFRESTEFHRVCYIQRIDPSGILYKQLAAKTGEVGTYSDQSHKEVLLHLMDVRERLANIEGRLGLPPPRPSIPPPALEPAAAPQVENPTQS